MATLKEFEEALRQNGMVNALAILEQLKKRDREKRSIAPARRIVGRKMTAELARTVLEMHATTGMTQQEIAFKLGVNQGRVNEVIKRGKWLNGDPAAPEARSRDKAMDRLTQRAHARRTAVPVVPVPLPVRPPVSDIVRTTTPSVRRDVSVSPAPRAAAGELPLERPAARPSAAEASKAALRRTAPTAPTPIVSAQLAFLDL